MGGTGVEVSSCGCAGWDIVSLRGSAERKVNAPVLVLLLLLAGGACPRAALAMCRLLDAVENAWEPEEVEEKNVQPHRIDAIYGRKSINQSYKKDQLKLLFVESDRLKLYFDW